MQYKISQKTKQMIFITIGSMIEGFALNLFLIPNKIAPGGVSGIATVLYHLTGLSPGMCIIAVNGVLFLLAFKQLGLEVVGRSLYAALVVSFTLDVIPLPAVTADPFLACVYGGIVLGIGTGLTDRVGGDTGGTFLAARLIQYYFPHFKTAWVLFGVDTVVVILSALVFTPEIALYALVALFISSRILELVSEGIQSARAVYIISNDAEEISTRILSEMNRGVTKLSATGMYTQEEKGVLLCVLDNTKELAQLKAIITGIDEDAFVFVGNVHEVMGEGFRKSLK